MSSNDGDFESTSTRARKRMLPSVAEVARELARRTGADAASILTTSRKVCSEELARIKDGHESAPVDVLVERARALLEDSERGAPPPTPVPAEPHFAAPAPPLAEGADPFGETSGRLDLRWDREGHDAPAGGVEPPAEGPPAMHPPTGFDVSFPLPSDAPPPPPEPAGHEPPAFAFSIDEPFASDPAATAEDEPPTRAPLQPSVPKRSNVPLFLGVVLLLLAVGGGAWYFLFGRAKAPAAPPAPIAARRPRPQAPPAEGSPQSGTAPAPGAPASPSVSSPPDAAAPQAAPPAAPPAPAAVPPTPVPTPVPTAVPTPVPTPVPAAAVKPPPARPAPAKPAAAAPAPAARPASGNGSVPPEPVPVEPIGGKTAPRAASAPAAGAPAQAQSRAGALVTPDWTAAPVFVVHFSSFVEKARAEKHAAALSKEFGVPVRAVQVDLGEKGTWYRSVAGEFQTADEALAFRKQLLDKGTQGVGLVYRMSGKK